MLFLYLILLSVFRYFHTPVSLEVKCKNNIQLQNFFNKLKILIFRNKYFPGKLLNSELLQRLRSVIVRSGRLSALEGG